MRELITKQRAKQINAAVEIHTQTPQEALALGYTTKSLAVANLPYKDIKKDRWTRKNGNYTFTVVALREGGKIPFGVIPRLFFIWLITEITRTRSREIILGNHFNDFLEKLTYKEDGGYTRKRVTEQLERLFSVAIGTYYDSDGLKQGIPPETFIDKFWLWDTKKHTEQQNLFPSKVIVKEKFYNEVIKSPVPIDMRVVEAFKNSAFKLDVYIWLTYRMFNVREPVRIKYIDLMPQFGNDYDPDNAEALKDFRKKLRGAIKDVLGCYKANVDTTSPKYIALYASPTSVPTIAGK